MSFFLKEFSGLGAGTPEKHQDGDVSFGKIQIQKVHVNNLPSANSLFGGLIIEGLKDIFSFCNHRLRRGPVANFMISFSNNDFVINLLEESGAVTSSQIREAREHARQAKREISVIQVLLSNAIVDEVSVGKLIAESACIPFVDLLEYGELQEEVVCSVAMDVARRYNAMPIAISNHTVTLALADPLNFYAMDSLAHLLNAYQVDFYCATHSQIWKWHVQYYGKEDTVIG